MLIIKSKKLCSVKAKKTIKGITKDRIYTVLNKNIGFICIYNDYGIKYWYSEKNFREVKSNEQK